MRITTSMTTSKMLLNINRNANLVDKYYTQLTSGKKIQRPSDDPIVASRALKFRTNIAETEQYQRNVSQGLSWMKVSEAAVDNVTKLLKSIGDLSVKGSNDSYQYDDRQAMAKEISQLLDQLQTEMNVTYAGRYVFSGYRTDEPPTMTNDSPAASYEINQAFTSSEIENVPCYYVDKSVIGSAPVVTVSNILKLPYNTKPGQAVTAVTVKDGSGAPVVVNSTYAPGVDPYATVADNGINFIPETGELVIGKDVVLPLDVTYQVDGLKKGDLNPVVYFDATDLVTGVSYNVNDQNLQYEFGANTKIQVNLLAKDVSSARLYADLKSLSDLLNGVSITSNADLEAKYAGLTNKDQLIADQITAEKESYRQVMREKFSNMIELVETHSAEVSIQFTTLGSRINRLDLIETRLEDDRVSYTDLMSQNEDVDVLEVLMKLNSADAIYQAAMQIGARISQISLANYL